MKQILKIREFTNSTLLEKEFFLDEAFIEWISVCRRYEPSRTRELFLELCKFLYLSSVSVDPISPSILLDDIWHEFILWDSEKYMKFCVDLFGCEVHHRRTDKPFEREKLYKIAEDNCVFLIPEFWISPGATGHESLLSREKMDSPPHYYSDADCG